MSTSRKAYEKQIRARALKEISSHVKALGLDVALVDKALSLYMTVWERGMVDGMTVTNYILAAIYLTYKKSSTYAPMDLLVKQSLSARQTRRVNLGAVRKAAIDIGKELGIPNDPVTPDQFIHVIAAKLAISERTQAAAKKILKVLPPSSHRPQSLAAASLYLASQQTHEPILHGLMALADSIGTWVPSIRSAVVHVRANS